jgi:glycosyltransferase involved in cell wall biosynthesis
MTTSIVYVIGQLGLGGAERQLLELVKGLDKKKYSPTVICLSSDVQLRNDFQKAGCTLIVIPKTTTFDVTLLPKLTKIFRDLDAQIVHGYLSTGVLWGTLAARFARVPYVVGGWRVADPKDSIFFKLINRLIGPLNDVLISNTNLMKELLIKRDGLNASKIFVVPNGVDLSRFEHLPSTKDARIQLGLNPTQPTIGMIARFFKQKDYKTFLTSVSQVAQEKPNLNAVCVGDGTLFKESCALAVTLGIDDRTHFLRARTDVPLIMRALNIGVLSSQWEGMPNALLELMAAQRAVVATDVGGNPEVVVHEKTGLLVPTQKPQAMAEAILRLLDNPELCEYMGYQGRQRVETIFTMSKMVEATESIYDRLSN